MIAGLFSAPVWSTETDHRSSDSSPGHYLKQELQSQVPVAAEVFLGTVGTGSSIVQGTDEKESPSHLVTLKEGVVQSKSLLKLKFNRMRNLK